MMTKLPKNSLMIFGKIALAILLTANSIICNEPSADPRVVFDDLLYKSIPNEADWKKLTSIQVDNFWNETNKKLEPAMKDKIWQVSAPMRDIEKGDRKGYRVSLVTGDDLKIPGTRCKWQLYSARLDSLEIKIDVAATLQRESLISFSGKPVCVPHQPQDMPKFIKELEKNNLLMLKIKVNGQEKDIFLIDVKFEEELKK